MRNLACKALMLLVFGLFACGESQSIRLDYSYQGDLNLDLVLVVGMAENSSDLSWSADISGLPGYEGFNFSLFADRLRQCADHLDQPRESDFEDEGGDLNDCLSMGESLGDGLFGGEEINLIDSETSLNPSLQIDEEDYLFSLFFFNSSSLSGEPRCVMMEVARRTGETFQIQSKGPASNLTISLTEPELNLDCFPL